jgi:hypothetical protein
MYGWNKVGIIDNMATISLHPVNYANVTRLPLHVMRAPAANFPDIQS